ncbi:MAG TPA: TonB family protein, partial [Thermoanaerobaculia bacterium]
PKPVGPVPAPEIPPRKGKGLVIAKGQTGEFARPQIPAPEPRLEPAPRRAVGERAAALPAAGESRKSRTGLVAGIGLAAVALIAGGLFVTKDRWLGARPSATAGVPKTEPTAVDAASAASAQPAAPAPALLEPAKIVDPKAVEAEARRLGAEREKALREAAKQPGTAGKPATASVPPEAVVGLAPVKVAEPPQPSDTPAIAAKGPEPAPTAVPVPRAPEPRPPEPVVEPASKSAPPPPVEVSVPDKAPVIPAASSAPAKEGDLVGPGEGVIEPRLVRLGSMGILPAQARQIKRGADGSIGTPLLMALIDEHGAVQDVRVLKPSSYKFVDEAAVRSLKSATIQPATKDGVKVKMWKTFTIAVKP